MNGAWLRTDLVQEARRVELDWIKRQGIYTKVPLEVCLQETKAKPISLRWIDTNKGDDERPYYRSRLVAREIKARQKVCDQLPMSQVFSAMPGLEAVKLLCSLMMSLQKSARGKPLKLASWDISRAHFYTESVRRVFVDLPAEDAEPGKCGLSLKTMYGTQDASK